MAECPFLVIMLFSYYPNYHSALAADLIDLAVGALGHRPHNPDTALSQQRSLFKDYLAMAVKVLNFLSWNRPHAPVKQLIKHKDALALAVIWLLRHTPCELVPSRKELLVASRYMLQAPELRDAFLPHMDIMLQTRTLEGPPNDGAVAAPSDSTLRGTALHLLSEVVSPLRDKLSLPQLSCVVWVLSSKVHEPTLPLSVQTLCVRVMLHLVDSICKHPLHPAPSDARRLMGWILQTLVHKLGALRHYLPRLEGADKLRLMEQDMQDHGTGAMARLSMAKDNR
jgi:transformation/transcription domain-associated protein